TKTGFRSFHQYWQHIPFFNIPFYSYKYNLLKSLTASVTGKGGNWREKPPDAESAIGAANPKVWANARTCPVHAVLGGVFVTESFLF
ncbi:MAG: hypothetical protein ACOYLR_11215, partial [Chlorobium sp.]